MYSAFKIILMDFENLLRKLELKESYVMDIKDSYQVFFEKLRNNTDGDKSFLETGQSKSKKKYVGNVGNNSFHLEHKNNEPYSNIKIYASGKVITSNDKPQIEINFDAFDKKWALIMVGFYTMFASMSLYPDFNLSTIMFLLLGLCSFPSYS